MNKSKAKTGLFGALAAVIFALVCAATLLFCKADPVVLVMPRAAESRTEAFLSAVCSEGSIADIQAMLYGQPDLEADRSPAEPVGAILWDAYRSSMDYELVGGCYARDSGLARTVRIRSLSLESVTESLGDRAREALARYVAEAEDMDQVYDENNNYREDLVMAVLEEVTRQAIAEDGQIRQQEITLKLVYDQGQWWIQPDQELLDVLFGGIG